MRTNDIKLSLTIPFYYDKPDRNGVMYTKEAIYDALNKLPLELPIMFSGNSADVTPHLIGNTTGKQHIVTDDTKNSRYLLTVTGNFYRGGTSETVKIDRDTKTVSEFNINSIGVSMLD